MLRTQRTRSGKSGGFLRFLPAPKPVWAGSFSGAAMPLLTVISGGPDTGKSLIQQALMAQTDYVLVARDKIRPTFGRTVNEGAITLVMVDLARSLLNSSHNVLAVAQNLHPVDRKRWEDVARETGSVCRWIHVEKVLTSVS